MEHLCGKDTALRKRFEDLKRFHADARIVHDHYRALKRLRQKDVEALRDARDDLHAHRNTVAQLQMAFKKRVAPWNPIRLHRCLLTMP